MSDGSKVSQMCDVNNVSRLREFTIELVFDWDDRVRKLKILETMSKSFHSCSDSFVKNFFFVLTFIQLTYINRRFPLRNFSFDSS